MFSPKEGEREPKVLHEDNDVVILAKPAGILTHPSPKNPEERTLVDFILSRWPEVQSVGEDPLRPGIVHRLDKETSGVLVLAKNQSAFQFLKDAFSTRKVEKAYLALVVGKMPEREGVITQPIGRGRKFGKFTTKAPRGKVREAVTKWKVLQEYKIKPALRDAQGGPEEIMTLLEVRPETGRTHQIRVHLAAIGHPVVGDPLYGGKGTRKYRVILGRTFLHATSLKLTLPSGETIMVASDLPPDLTAFLTSLENLEAATQA